MKRVFIIGILSSMIGCRGRVPEAAPPFKLAGPKILQPGEAPRDPSAVPKPVVSLRGGGGEVKLGDKIPCDVTLTVPSPPMMPGRIMVELLQGGRIFDFSDAVPYQDAGSGVYILRAELNAPKQAGRYQIRAASTDDDIRRGRDGAEDEIFPFLTRSIEINVEVKP